MSIKEMGSVFHFDNDAVNFGYQIVVEQLKDNGHNKTCYSCDKTALIPPATMLGEMSPAASMASKALIIPITVPINPNIGANGK